MEFEELKKVWDKQNDKPMYIIDETSLHSMVTKQKSGAIKKAKIMEYCLIGANLIAGSFVIIIHLLKGSENIYAFLLGVLMVCTAFFLMVKRNKRLNKNNEFERSINGELDHGLSDAKYVVTMSRTSQFYFAFVSLLVVLEMGFDDLLKTLLFSLFFLFVLYASTWEHRWYVNKYKKLKELKRVLDSEETTE